MVFLGGAVDKNLFVNAGDMGLIPGLGRSYWALTLEPILHSKRSHCKEKPSQHREEPPHAQQLEKAPGQQWRPGAAKNKQTNKKAEIKRAI